MIPWIQFWFWFWFWIDSGSVLIDWFKFKFWSMITVHVPGFRSKAFWIGVYETNSGKHRQLLGWSRVYYKWISGLHFPVAFAPVDVGFFFFVLVLLCFYVACSCLRWFSVAPKVDQKKKKKKTVLFWLLGKHPHFIHPYTRHFESAGVHDQHSQFTSVFFFFFFGDLFQQTKKKKTIKKQKPIPINPANKGQKKENLQLYSNLSIKFFPY